MFGNQQQQQQQQQKRQTENINPSASSPNGADKRSWKSTVTRLGLGGLKTALAEEETSSRPEHAISQLQQQQLYDTDPFSPYNNNDDDGGYDYGKASSNRLIDQAPPLPRTWDASPYSRYYDVLVDENRRKRSEKSTVTGAVLGGGTSTAKALIDSPRYPAYPTATLVRSAQLQTKRSVPIYQEPRFKRELDIDPEDVLTLLSLWENERHKRNWHRNLNEEYDNAEDEDNLLVGDENPRNAISWVDSPMYPPRRYSVPASFTPSDIGILRTHPSGFYYNRYDSGGDDEQDDGDDVVDDDEGSDDDDDDHRYGQRYDASRYADARYGLVYPRQTYHETLAKSGLLSASRKRSQMYDPYGGAIQFQMNPRSRGHLYQHRSVY